MKNPRNIVITGASSGLGAALARYYAGSGITLHLQGRNSERLQEVVNDCRAKGAEVHPKIVDVTQELAMRQWLESADDAGPVDLIIANAGISAGSGGKGESAEQAQAIMATNVSGVMHSIHPLLPRFCARNGGQIAILSSLAGIRALPSSPAYSASKACVRYYGDALRGLLADKNVQVSLICPGYIRTPMTAVNDFPMPGMMPAEKAAALIAKGLAQGKGVIGFPLRMYVPLWLLACLHHRITDPIFSRLPAKPSWGEPPL